MLFLLSPAKSLDETTLPPHLGKREPSFMKETSILAKAAKNLSVSEIKSLMKISDNLAELNYQRFQTFAPPFTNDNAKPAIYLFKGDVYNGLNAYDLSEKAINYLDKNLVILSGLYGGIRALDLIQPYRLEMGTRFENERGKNLYEFWGDQVTHYLNERIQTEKHSCVINLASNEYFKVIDPKKLTVPLITPIFKDLNKNGEYRIISFYAKKARGLMMRFASETESKTIEDLKKFTLEEYRFENCDNPEELLFLRG